MIEDLEGATPEAGRRRHVLGVSIVTVGAVAVLFLALVLAPREIGELRRASLPQPTASAAPDRGVGWSPILSTVDQARQRVCAYGAGTQWVVVSTIPIDGRLARLPSVRNAPERNTAEQYAPVQTPHPSFWMTVTCSPDDVIPPGTDLRNIAR